MTSVLLLIAATCLWGVSSAAMSRVEGAPTAVSLAALGGGIALLCFARATGGSARRTFSEAPRLYVRLGVLEAANLILFAAALRIGPLPIVVALHLTTPLLLIGAQIVRGTRRGGAVVALEVGLVAVAILLASSAGPGDARDQLRTIVGCALALASAVCVAVLVSTVAKEARSRTTPTSAGLQLVFAGLLSSVLLVADPPTWAGAAQMVVIGVFLLGPGFALYWAALRVLDATTASIIGLNEAVVASIIGAAMLHGRVTVGAVVAAALVLSAVAMEQYSQRAWRVR
ncbi:EamA family transporter [Nocardia halotolerans]|uniref:EamA family transporter n=1 Tax=Nocardia halotolerans TaxID=1755878 RepID=A0ABV8VCT3_9NOCA